MHVRCQGLGTGRQIDKWCDAMPRWLRHSDAALGGKADDLTHILLPEPQLANNVRL